MVDYYDKLVIAVPAVISLGVVASIHPAVTVSQGLGLGGLLSTVIVFEMLFRNPPVEPTPGNVGAVVVWGSSLLLAVVLYL